MAEVSSHGRRGRAASVGTGGRRRLPHRPGHVPHAVDPDPCFPRVPRPLRLRGRLRFVSRAIFLVFRRGRDRAGDTAYCRATMPRPSMSDARCVAPPASRVRVYCFTLRVSFNGLVARFSAQSPIRGRLRVSRLGFRSRPRRVRLVRERVAATSSYRPDAKPHRVSIE